MREVSSRNFGLLIAYIVPGFVSLVGIGFFSPEMQLWLLGPDNLGPSLGGFLYVSIGSVAAGMTANAVRWAAIDSIHHATGISAPEWRDEALGKQIAAYDWLVENHYRHYQFYGNTLCSLVFGYICWHASGVESALGWADGAVLILLPVLFVGSRTTLSRYYVRYESLLHPRRQGEDPMANGGHHETKPKPGKEQVKTDGKQPNQAPKPTTSDKK